MSFKANKALRVTLSAVIVVALVVALVFVFANSNSTERDQRVAKTNYAILDSQNYSQFEQNISSNLDSEGTSFVKQYALSIKDTNTVLYNKYEMLHLQYALQWKQTQQLAINTIYGGDRSALQNIDQKLNDYAEKLANTLTSVKVFNQDFNLASTSDSAKQAEFEKVLQDFKAQTTCLVELNNIMLDFVKQNNYQTITSSNCASQDLKLVLLQTLNAQGNVLQNTITSVFAENKITATNKTTYGDSLSWFNAYQKADANAFVYKNINSIQTDCTVEQFVTLFDTSVADVQGWLSSQNKTDYVSKLSADNENKQRIILLNSFLQKLAQ